MHANGITSEKNHGAGHQFSHRAYHDPVCSGDRSMTAFQYIHRWGWDEMLKNKHAAEGNSEDEAIEKLLKLKL